MLGIARFELYERYFIFLQLKLIAVLGFSNTDIRLGATWIMGTTQQGPHDQETRRPEQTHHFTTPFPPSNFTNGKFDLDFECGVPDVQSTSRGLIIGGIPAQRGQFPW